MAGGGEKKTAESARTTAPVGCTPLSVGRTNGVYRFRSERYRESGNRGIIRYRNRLKAEKKPLNSRVRRAPGDNFTDTGRPRTTGRRDHGFRHCLTRFSKRTVCPPGGETHQNKHTEQKHQGHRVMLGEVDPGWTSLCAGAPPRQSV